MYLNASKFDMKLFLNDLHSALMVNKKNLRLLTGIDDYIDSWERVFIDLFKREMNKKQCFCDEENFYTVIYLSNSEIRIHFNISKAKIISQRYTERKIPLILFSTYENNFSTFKFTSANSLTLTNNCKSPIITVPYQIGGFNYLTIDGNHRITQYKLQKKETVNVVILKLNDVLTLIKSDFEKAIYIFLYEGINVEHFINNSATKYYYDGAFHIF